MQEAYVNICGIPTHIFSWGRWIEESLNDVKEVCICITGNPGLPGYYTEFLGNLYNKLEPNMPIWVIGHVGHDDPPPTSIRLVPSLKGNEEIFNLNGQIQHKIEFIKKYAPENAKIHLIGHSIGAYIILQLLQHPDIKNRVQKCYMLFPTIERMRDTPNGWYFTKIAAPAYSYLGFVFKLFYRLPVTLRILFLSAYFWLTSVPTHFIGTTLKYFKPSVVEKVVHLAKDELNTVCTLQKDLILENSKLLKFYYGENDGWVPVKFYKELKAKYPNVDAELDTRKINHAFVLRSSIVMSDIVSKMISRARI